MVNQKFYWSYYLSLAEDVSNLSKYIEFSKPNYSTYSTELAKLFLVVGSENDVVLKALCEAICSKNKLKNKAKNITGYCKFVTDNYPYLSSQKVILHGYDLDFQPWEAWGDEDDEEGPTSPDWWKNYNGVKHNRSTNYSKANLSNVLQALAGLFLANIYFELDLQAQRDDCQFPIELSDVVRHLPRGCDLFRIDDPLAYLGD